MMESYDDCTERLYLQKSSSGDISVPCSALAQHQIDGIRFLYKQYKKRKQGVVMNYPSGCGTSVQIAMFLQAILKDLEKPILILYNTDDEREAWIERFKKWTTIDGDKIGVNLTNSARKLIYIMQMESLRFWSRLCSIVIVKSDEVDKIIFKCPLKADFKIWITSIDMKKDRKMFCNIFKWMYTKSLPQIVEVIDNAKESYTDRLLLDSILDDVVSTASNLKPFRPPKRHQERVIEITPKVTRKNKDATGLKIKRSKKNLETPSTSDITGSVDTFTSNIDSFALSNNNVNIIRKEIEDDEDKLDVESFIRDNEPLESIDDCHLNMAVEKLENGLEVAASEENSSKTNELRTNSNTLGIAFQNGADNNVIVANASTEESRNKRLSGQNDDLSQESTKNENESKDLIFSTMPLNQNVFSISTGEENSNCKPELDKREEKGENSSDESINVEDDQEAKVEVTTNVTQETDDSFDSKIRDLEERALKKFKGSFLDKIF